MTHRMFNVAHGLVQTTCTSVNVFFSFMGLTMLFTKKRKRLPILVRIGSYVLPQTTCFKYLGIFFDAALPPKSKLINIGGRCFLGSASVLFDTAV
jgi:hypothetical protein